MSSNSCSREMTILTTAFYSLIVLFTHSHWYPHTSLTYSRILSSLALQHFMDASHYDDYFSCSRPSQVAAGALLLTHRVIGILPEWVSAPCCCYATFFIMVRDKKLPSSLMCPLLRRNNAQPALASAATVVVCRSCVISAAATLPVNLFTPLPQLSNASPPIP